MGKIIIVCESQSDGILWVRKRGLDTTQVRIITKLAQLLGVELQDRPIYFLDGWHDFSKKEQIRAHVKQRGADIRYTCR